tara:strand:+ start:995 stop:1861 length:867 start_codon:yes stop_codon:yes gene_type:complete
MKFTDLNPTINEAGPAVLALPVGFATMEGLALAMGFASANALSIHIQNNPREYNKAMKYMGQTYTDISNWVKGNEGSGIEDAPRSLTSQLDSYARQGLGSQNREIRDQVSASTQAIIDQVDKDADAQAEITARWSADARAETDRAADAYQAALDLTAPGNDLVDLNIDGVAGNPPGAGAIGSGGAVQPGVGNPPGAGAIGSGGAVQPGVGNPPGAGAIGTGGIKVGELPVTGADAITSIGTTTQGGGKNVKGRKVIGGGGGDKSTATANQMKFNPINIRDPLNLKRYG